MDEQQIEQLRKAGAVLKEYENDGEIVTLQTAHDQKAAEEWEYAKKVRNPFACLRVAKMTTPLGDW